MGEARRRKLAGNTAPSKQWQADKAAKKHEKKLESERRAQNRAMNPALR
ncbi:hypothetical protein [Cohnella thailandensis]|uniref:Uncharacterized protein n=1 Tax=Cohnella thailandensis TaxID=557557 RepID=A0A841SNN3_9BACL|nr:hypothetical protein [Cohnella thailandensis]MBB6632792.1 hypothetical protein [Cohnella thailandensis]MBP1975517.1 hypothetical protein [Cohnella thailandensis]